MLSHIGYIDLPEHAGPGGFDHAAVHTGRRRIYVAHTANNALDVLDGAVGRYLESIPDLTAVAGALVCEESDLVITSNRGEDTIALFPAANPRDVRKIHVGVRPNGLAYDPDRKLLLAANVGDPDRPGSFTLSMVDVQNGKLLAEVPVPGRTRWAVFDRDASRFFVNIASPAEIVVVAAGAPDRVARSFVIPAAGPHGLDYDQATGRLFSACDAGVLVTLDSHSGRVVDESALSGVPDVVFFNARRRHLYVAVGDPGVIDVFDTDTMARIDPVSTESGAHTIAFDPSRDTVYAFLPKSHRAQVFEDTASSVPRG